MNNNLLVALCAVAIGLSSVSVLGNANDSNNGNTSKIANLSPVTQQQHHDKLDIARLQEGATLGAVLAAYGLWGGVEFKTPTQKIEAMFAVIATIASLAVFNYLPDPTGSSIAL